MISYVSEVVFFTVTAFIFSLLFFSLFFVTFTLYTDNYGIVSLAGLYGMI